MKKSVLFVTNTLGLGGAEKSLIEVLKVMNKQKYEIDLLIIDFNIEHNQLIDQVPKEVNILASNEMCNLFFQDFLTGAKNMLKQAHFLLLIKRIVFLIFCRIGRSSKWTKIVNFKILRNIYPIITKRYDIAISVRYEYPNYYVIDCIDANKKYAWLHAPLNASSILVFSISMEKEYLLKFDKLLCVSKMVQKSYVSKIPELINKTEIIYNLIDEQKIMILSNEEVENGLFNKEKVSFVSAMRISKDKRPLFIIEIAKKLKKEGLKFDFVIIGNGELLPKCLKKVRKYKLENSVHFIGFRSNPYCYIKRGDVYIQPSVFETWGIGITEARLLGKPIITSSYESAYEQIVDCYNGYIAKNDLELYEKIRYLICNPNHIRDLSRNSLQEIKKNICENINRINSIGD